MEDLYKQKEKELGPELMKQVERLVMLNTLDNLWMNHLEDMEYLRDSVRLRAYGQRDPLVEYKNESRKLFKDLLLNFESQAATIILKIQPPPPGRGRASAAMTGGPPKPVGADFSKVGRNDPCPCGATYPDGKPKKYKDCHGK